MQHTSAKKKKKIEPALEKSRFVLVDLVVDAAFVVIVAHSSGKQLKARVSPMACEVSLYHKLQ